MGSKGWGDIAEGLRAGKISINDKLNVNGHNLPDKSGGSESWASLANALRESAAETTTEQGWNSSPADDLKALRNEFHSLSQEKHRKAQKWDMEGNYLGEDEKIAAEYDRKLQSLEKRMEAVQKPKSNKRRDQLIDRLQLLEANAGAATTVELADQWQKEQKEIRAELAKIDKELENPERYYDTASRAPAVIKNAAKQTGAGLVGFGAGFMNAADQLARDNPELFFASTMGATGGTTDAILAAQSQQFKNKRVTDDSVKQIYTKLYDVADKWNNEAAVEMQKAKEGLSWAGQVGVDIAANMIQMGIDAAGKAAGFGMVPFFLRAAGSGVLEARDAMAQMQEQENAAAEFEGRKPRKLFDDDAIYKQMGYGLTAGAIELATEKLFDGLAGIFGKGAADDVVERLIGRLTQNNVGRTILRAIAGASGEGAEEVISDLLNPFAQRIYNDEAIRGLMENGYDMSELAYDFLIGAAVGGFGSVTTILSGESNYKNAILTAESMEKKGSSPAEIAAKTGLEKINGKWTIAENSSSSDKTAFKDNYQTNSDAEFPQYSSDEIKKSASNETESTIVNTDPEKHTPQEQKIIDEYQNSVNDGLKELVEDHLDNPHHKFVRYNISNVSERQAQDISALVGGDYIGFSNSINTFGINHIIKRHGPNGQENMSMKDPNDIARIGYILDNYDTVDILRGKDGKQKFSTEFRDKNDKPAPVLIYNKKINGTYYVVEAIVDTKYKKLWAVTAYIDNKRGVTQASNAQSPGYTVEPSLASPPLNENITYNAAESNVNEYQKGVNVDERKNVFDGRPEWRDGERSGEQTQILAEGTGRSTQTVEQIRTAGERQTRGRNLPEVNSKELGLGELGTDRYNLKLIPTRDWDSELKETAEKIKAESGREVKFVLGRIEIQSSDGGTQYARGVITDKKIVVQADHSRLSVAQIAEHELYHSAAENNPGTNWYCEQKIKEKYGEEKFTSVVGAYIQKLRGIIDIPENATEAEIDEAVNRIKEEIFADAYAGINAFGAGADRFSEEVRDTVEERTGKGRVAAEDKVSRGPPKFSYGGEKAENADLEALDKAERMEMQGVDPETIRQQTGWFRSMDKKWRFEIDDSGMKVTGQQGDKLGDIIEHKELFKNYPELKNTRLRFEMLEDGERGYYSRKDGEIVLSNKLTDAPENTLIHEIQHAIQQKEGFAGGASLDYWEDMIDSGYNSRTREQQSTLDGLELEYNQIRNSNPEFIQDMRKLQEMTPTVPRGEIDWDTLEQISEDPPEWQAFDKYRDKLSDKYGEKKVLSFMNLIEKIKQAQSKGRSADELYKNTAGEIEARDTAERRRLSEEERRSRRPAKGNEDTVFSEGNIISYNKEDYSTEGVHWGIAQGIITKKEARAAWKAIADHDKIGYSYNETSNGDIFVESEDTLMLINPDYNHPVIKTIYKFDLGYEDQTGLARRLLIDAEGLRSKEREAIEIINDTFGQGSVIKFDSPDNYEVQRENGRGKGSNGRENTGRNLKAEFSRNAQDKEFRFSADDEEYENAVEVGDMRRARKLVDEAAVRAGVISENGKPKHLYHGTAHFGFSEFKPGTIFLSDKHSIAAGYTQNKGYGRKRKISEAYTPDDGSVSTLLKNAKNVLGEDYREIQKEDIKEKTEKLKSTAGQLAKKIDEAWTSEASDFLYSISNGEIDTDNDLANILTLPGSIDENIYDFIDGSGYYTKEELELWLRWFDNSYEKTRDFFVDHYDEIKNSPAKDLDEIIRGYSLSDFAIYVRLDLLKLMSGNNIISQSGNVISEDKLRDRVNTVKDVGAYDLYGFAGKKPLIIDGNGSFWTNIKVPEFDAVMTTDEIAKRAKEAGYTSVVIKNIMDSSMNEYASNEHSDVYIFFNSNDLKSADPVTYDDNGDIIPLSRRFNREEKDIRFSADDEPKPYDEEHSKAWNEFLEAREGKMLSEPEAKRARRAKSEKEITETLNERDRDRAELRKKAREEVKDQAKPSSAKADLKRNLTGLFSIPAGKRQEMGNVIDNFADHLLNKGDITDRDRRALFDRLYAEGVMSVPADEYYAMGRGELVGGRIYVNDSIKHEFGDDWKPFYRRAFAAGIYLTNNPQNTGVDGWNADLSQILPGLFDAGATDGKEMLERIVQVAEDGKEEKMSLADYTAMLADQEHITADELLDDMERKVDLELQKFAEKAELEIKLRSRNILKDATEKAERREQIQRNKERRELKELQPKTLKQLQWLSKNRHKAPEDLKKVFDAVLDDLDIYAVGVANELNWSKKHQATWKDLSEMYQAARENDPNFLPSEDLERIFARVNKIKIGEMNIEDLHVLYNAAVDLRTEFYNRRNVLNDQYHRIFEDVYEDSTREINSAGKPAKGRLGKIFGKEGFTGNLLDRLFNLEQLSPMNVFERMAGWNPNSTFYQMAKQLEKGERDIRAYTVEAQQMLKEFLTENEEWVRKSDGQGKDAIWYELEVPELLEWGKGDRPIFGPTVKVHMTPSQKVYLYLESKNYDNLRHMEGGRTFVNKELYSKGKRQEALAQGTTIRLAPETVKKIVSDLTPEEKALAAVLEKYFNGYAKEKINRVSNILVGYDKATTSNYAPIYTNKNYNQSQIGIYDATAEGVGNLKERQHSKTPSYNLSAYDAFERHVDQTARYVGMAIPARNWQTLLNWRGDKESMTDTIAHKWGQEGVKYIEDLLATLQGNQKDADKTVINKATEKLMSNYITAIFGFNPSIVFKQLGSIPMGSVYLGFDNFPSVQQVRDIDRGLISKYTKDLDHRLLGYSDPETKQLKEAPNLTEKTKATKFLLGGGAITAMDGWAASVLWPQAENKVHKEYPELEVGTQEEIDAGQSPFYRKVAEEFNNAVARSQSTSDEMHQSTLKKSRNPIAKAFTMFKSDSAQSYNALRQKMGELEYYKSKGDGVGTEQAKKEVGTAVTAMLINAVWGQTVGFLLGALKNGAKQYKDDDDELSWESWAKETVSQIVGSLAGTIAGGEELAEIIGSILSDEEWHGFSTPGLEQFSDMIDQITRVMESGGGHLHDLADVIAKGGSPIDYFKRYGKDIVGDIKDIAVTAATYIPGLPVKNVEAYLMGIVRTVIPEAGVAWDNLSETPSRYALRGMHGRRAQSEIKAILKNRLGKPDREVPGILLELYEAGYENVIPMETPQGFTVNGINLEMSAAQQQQYDNAWSDAIGEGINELVKTEQFQNADAEKQAEMIENIYSYAHEKGKAAVSEDYKLPYWAEAADNMKESGSKLETWAIWQGSTYGMKNSEKYDELAKSKFSEKDKLSILPTITGPELKTETGAPTYYAKVKSAVQTGLTMAEALELGKEYMLEEYLEWHDNGLTPDQAFEVAETVDEFPEDATWNEKYVEIAELPYAEDVKEIALQGIMNESNYEKYMNARNAGIPSYEYCVYMEALSRIESDKYPSGRTIRNSRKTKVVSYIDNLKITTNQKKALMIAAGYSESTARKVHWTD